jgi:hypothetical protein
VRKLQLQTDEMAAAVAPRREPNEIQKANIARQLTLSFLEKELRFAARSRTCSAAGRSRRDQGEGRGDRAAARRDEEAIAEQQAIVDKNMQSRWRTTPTARAREGLLRAEHGGLQGARGRSSAAFRMVEQAMALEAFLKKTSSPNPRSR